MTARSDEIKQRDARLKELRADLDKAEALVSEMRKGADRTPRGSLGFRLSAPSLPSAMAPIGRLSNTSNAADVDRRETVAWRARKRARDALPEAQTKTLAKGRELVLDLAPPLADRFVFEVALIDYGPVLLRITFGSRLAAGTLSSEPSSGGFRSALAVSGFRLRARLGFSMPSSHFGQRGFPPAFGYALLL